MSKGIYIFIGLLILIVIAIYFAVGYALVHFITKWW